MRFNTLALSLICIAAAAATTAYAAGAEADFKAVLAAAQAAEHQARQLEEPMAADRQALAAARKAADAGDFDTAVKLAQQAEALAKASIAQSKEQDAAWRDAVIR